MDSYFIHCESSGFWNQQIACDSSLTERLSTRSTLFPSRRSSDLVIGPDRVGLPFPAEKVGEETRGDVGREWEDRKSTRLNSSHANISYAVFCLKKNIKALTATLRDC